MEILYLSHCVPNPPNKGEKIRAHQEILALARRHHLHLACFGRTAGELDDARRLEAVCASVYAEVRKFPRALAGAAAGFALGQSLNTGFFRSRGMSRYVRCVSRRVRLDAAVVFTVPMAQYVPEGVPAYLDLVDMDSEKWFEYARMRKLLAPLYRAEAQRLRSAEMEATAKAARTFLSTENEAGLLQQLGQRAVVMENGVDFDYFDPARVYGSEPPATGAVVFIGTLDYFPNIDAACWFAKEVLPVVRRRDPRIDFLIVGNRPVKEVLALGRLDGVTVAAGVPDVRPYLHSAKAVVAPLRLARGVQNKVLEAIAMGRPVFSTTAVCNTFGANLPRGVIRCDTPEEFAAAILRDAGRPSPAIRIAAMDRFDWACNLRPLLHEFGRSMTAGGGEVFSS